MQAGAGFYGTLASHFGSMPRAGHREPLHFGERATPAAPSGRIGRLLQKLLVHYRQLNQAGGPPAGMIRDAVALLATARILIEDSDGWVQENYSTGDGRYCAMGALHAAAGSHADHDTKELAQRLLKTVAWYRGYRSVEQMNDTCSHREVLEAIDAAITLASEDAPTYFAARLLADIGAGLPPRSSLRAPPRGPAGDLGSRLE